MAEIDRFDEKIDDTVFKRLDGVVERWITGHDDDRQCVVGLVDVLGQRQPVHSRHVDIGKTAVDGLLFENIDGLQAVAGRHHLVAPAFEILAGDIEDAFLIINKQNGFLTGLVHNTAH